MLIWKNIDGTTSLEQPWRVRLPDRTTRTNDDITPEHLALAGWSQEQIEDAATGNVSVAATTTGTEP